VIVDSSVLVAVVRDEPDAEGYRVALARADSVLVSAATHLEASIVVTPESEHQLDAFLDEARARIVPFDAQQAIVAREAYARYGKGSRSPAQLNFGDCTAYALARIADEPLLFKGDDFRHTDVTSALDD
jgi:ribonuclease VapC